MYTICLSSRAHSFRTAHKERFVHQQNISSWAFMVLQLPKTHKTWRKLTSNWKIINFWGHKKLRILRNRGHHSNLQTARLTSNYPTIFVLYGTFSDLPCFWTLQLILNSMHKYQPRVHIIRKRDHTASVINLKSEEMKTFTFPETNFIGVTAYQNQLVSIFSRANCFIKYHIFNPALFVAFGKLCST